MSDVLSTPPSNDAAPGESAAESSSQSSRDARAVAARSLLILLYRLRRQERLFSGGQPRCLEAKLTAREVREMFDDDAIATKYPPILTYQQTAELVQVSENTLKGWFSQGKYADSVKRNKPGRVGRDAFVREFMLDNYGVNQR